MLIEEEQVEEIGEYVRDHIDEWLAGKSVSRPSLLYEIDLRERIVRVEEELRHQRELMREGFAHMDKRFEAMQEQMDKRFEAIDKRFEAMQEQMDRRFEAMDKRFDAMTKRIDRFMIWTFGITVSVAIAVTSALRIWSN
uniref:DUF1640 domain-containing protein n=1 Tax=Candidatus Kentrum sp. MB TaxID=2138164 RepID=A0A450XQU4_9GAMM|nr:MAG: hypothetical protein BECKMB1821G_GA0114241_10896 [Candidatus Kentron sp. MB]